MATPCYSAEWLSEHPEARAELVRGELRPVSPAGWRHGAVALELGRRIADHVQEHGLGAVLAAETGFLIERGPDTVRAPDVAFVSNATLASARPLPESAFWPGAPDLVVEVVSESDTFSALEEKTEQWLARGCEVVAIFDPRRCVAQIRTVDDVRVVRSPDDRLEFPGLLPGWSVRLGDLFAPIDAVEG